MNKSPQRKLAHDLLHGMVVHILMHYIHRKKETNAMPASKHNNVYKLSDELKKRTTRKELKNDAIILQPCMTKIIITL